MNVHHRAALWTAAPSLAPGGAANRGDHTPVESGEALLIQHQIEGSLPAGHRPLLVRFLPPPSETIARPFDINRFMGMTKTVVGDFSISAMTTNLPWEIKDALTLIPAPSQSSVNGSALDYVQKFVQSVVFTTSLSALDWAGCWHAVGSTAHVFNVDSGRVHLGRAAIVSLLEPMSEQGEPSPEWAENESPANARRLPPARTRSVAELLDLLINAAAKHEVFVRSGVHPAIMRRQEVVPLEHFATKRQLEAVIALDCALKQNERAPVLQTLLWRDETIVAGRRTKLQERLTALQERLGNSASSYPKF